jgi:hypothetical protein
MLRIEQVVANLFGCGGRLGCIWDWHRDGKRQNDSDQRLAAKGFSMPQGCVARLLHRLVRCGRAELFGKKLLILVVVTDPIPKEGVVFEDGECSIARANAN